MTYVRVTPEEMARVRAKIAEKKAKREVKRVELGLPERLKAPRPLCKRPRASLSERQLQILNNDELWSQAVRKRDRELYGPLCRICHRREANCGYHLVPKKRGQRIRWLLENGVGGCSPCNGGERYHPALYRERHVSLVGKDTVERIERIARMGTADFTLDELEQIGAWLKSAIEKAPGSATPGPPQCLQF